jgi:hypothetical protein
MTVAFDAVSNNGAGTFTTSAAWTHTPVGTPRGVLLLSVTNLPASGADSIDSVTYGGVAMAEVALSPLFGDQGAEDGLVEGWFLGASIPTGAQTVSVTATGTPAKKAIVVTFTASGDTQVADTTVVNSGGQANTSLTVGAAGVEALPLGVLHHGFNDPSFVSPGTNYADLLEFDLGSQTCSFIRRTSVVTGETTVDWTHASEEAHALAVAIREAAQSIPVAQVVETDIAQAVGRAKARAVGLVTETDVAQPVGRAKARVVGQVTSIEIAQPITVLKSRIIGQVVETDLGGALGRAKARVVAQALETDIPQPIAASENTNVAVAQALETAVAQPVGRAKARAVGQATEVDIAALLGHAKARPVGQVVETDLAQPITSIGGLLGDVDYAIGRPFTGWSGTVAVGWSAGRPYVRRI